MSDALVTETSAAVATGRGARSHTRSPAAVLAFPLDGRLPTVATTRGRIAKRALDLVVAVPLLVVLGPVLLALMALVRLTSDGPALFRQRRVGRGGEPFTVLKLRSMVVDAEDILACDDQLAAEYWSHGCKLTVDRDPRITPVGRFLRRTSLDELPQLLNVVAGTMSLVGPRPVLEDELSMLYDAAGRWAYEATKPGMTGLWQVSGRSQVTHADRARLDVRYVDTWTARADVVLLARTLPAVLRGVGAH